MIKSKAVTSSLSSDGSSLKVGSFSFGSPLSVSAVSKPILEIKATEYNTNISTPILSGLEKNSFLLVLWLQSPLQKSAMVGLMNIPEQEDQEVLGLDYEQRGVNLRH